MSELEYIYYICNKNRMLNTNEKMYKIKDLVFSLLNLGNRHS